MAPGSQDSVVTEHRVAAPPPDTDVLCGTAFVGGHSFTLQLATSGVIELGRGADADVQLVSGGVSRAHARLTLNGDRGLVEDLGSRNGTFVNRVRASAATPVGHGDEIGIGDARFVLYRRSALPEGVVPALVRRALIARIDADIAAGVRPALFVVQLPERWYEIRPARELIGKLASVGYAGLYNDQILAFAVHASRGEALTVHASTTRGLRMAGIEAASGFAFESQGDAELLLNAALKALLSAQDDDAETTEQPIVVEPGMVRLYEEARRIALSPASVLLVGETGVGKEVFARTIHVASGRKGPLVCVNTAALPEQLLESELFGHEKGAFSGAATSKVGLVETAHGGTLFLDEIGDMPMTLQAKLLRILEDRAVRRVGATTERKVDVRIVAATNSDLEEAVREKRFRRDLLFRLNACTLHIPPLRERRGEILRLAEVFLTRAAASMSAPHLRLGADAQEALTQHPWPGNVRELRNVIDRAAALCAPTGEAIGVKHLPESLRGGAARAPAAPGAPGSEMIRDSMRDFERQRILEALDKTGGNQTQAAEMLGLPRRTLAYKMSRLGIRSK